ncbi:MAG: DUF305 domain-containing protein [Acidobacteria bacterium]|nr:DUF305 domain-containing protein [Acidobacteriota bacterium]
MVAIVAAGCSSTNESSATNGNANRQAAATASPSAASATPASSHDMGGMDHGKTGSSPNAASAPYDLQFIDTIIVHHQSAVDMAKMAGMKTQNADLKAFAKKIIEDQEREIAQMKKWREGWYAGKPQAINMEMPGMNDSMKGMDMKGMNAATGNAFDLMFIDMMTAHHQGAVTMAREALTRAEHPEIKRLAQAIIDAQEAEIAQMNKWKAAWTR